MGIIDKYQSVISLAQSLGFQNLKEVEKDGVLYITGIAPSSSAKQQVWDAYTKLDPDMRASDLILKIDIDPNARTEYIVKAGENLSKIASKYPGVTWQDIYNANKAQIKNPDVIQPGWKLIIPTK